MKISSAITGEVSRRVHWILFSSLGAATLAFDLWTKSIFFDLLKIEIRPDPSGQMDRMVVMPHQPIVIIPNFFEIEGNINYGAFSGWFSHRTGLLALLSVAALGAIAWFLWSSLRGPGPHRLWFTAALGLLWGGTAGNLYDRAAHGYVRDFIKWFFVYDGKAHVWPNFNIADSAICVGVGIILVLFLKSPARKPRPS